MSPPAADDDDYYDDAAHSRVPSFSPPFEVDSAPRDSDPITVPVYYDFASSLCHVAHRVMGRMPHVLDELGISLTWIPIDLAALLNWRRGHVVSDRRRDHVRHIAEALDVSLTIPTHWLDSSAWHAVALHQLARDRAEGTLREPTLRERVFTRVHDEARAVEGADATLEMAAEFGFTCERDDLEQGLAALEDWTRHAAHQMVSGVPTFMLAEWPFGGIQEDATMESIFRRWAAKVRRERVGRMSSASPS